MSNRIVIRLAVLGVSALAAALLGHAKRGPAADGYRHELTAEVRARGLTFAPGVSAADQQWVLAAVAKARPEALQLIGAVDGLVTIGVTSQPDAPFVGMARQGTDEITLNIAYLDGERKQDRAQTVLHELGHIVDFELIDDDLMRGLAASLPPSGGCVTAERGDCTAPEERFADTFAKWALHGAVSGVGAGYGVSSPASLEAWGTPLATLAARQSVTS